MKNWGKGWFWWFLLALGMLACLMLAKCSKKKEAIKGTPAVKTVPSDCKRWATTDAKDLTFQEMLDYQKYCSKATRAVK